MKAPKNLVAVALAVLLAACLLTYYYTGDSARPAAPQPKSGAAAEPSVDRSLMVTALQLSPSAATSEEQAQAREAWRLADHELDLAFAAALRDAEAQAAAALAANSRLQQLSEGIAKLKDRVAADKKRVDDLGKDAGDSLDLAQAQLDLDQDELDDAQEDLTREGGEKRARLQRLLQEHEASDKDADQMIKFGAPAPTGTLSEQFLAWLSLGGYDRQLKAASEVAARDAKKLVERHNTLEGQLGNRPGASASGAQLRELSEQHKTLAGLDQRAQDTTQLAAVYQSWSALVETRERAVLHLVLRSLAAIVAILLATVLLNRAMTRAFRQVDRQRLRQVRVIARVALQTVAVLLILLILFGPPTQISALIGLVTAGLTVALKDYIVAFFGWFTLSGRNGIRVGDWVEIEGVSGEVIEIGLLKTVLLELGNWTETGHPTGRRVAFSNSFALEQHYFNFSTADQWLWDELQLPLPQAGDPIETARQIREIVERTTEADAAAATKEWERVTAQYGAREFTAAPAVHLRPGASGLEVVVRYITRAPRRNIVRAELLRAVVDLLLKPVPSERGAREVVPSP